MCEVTSKAKASLPYEMVITLILREFRISISEEKPKKDLRHTDIYNVQPLHIIGFKKINRHWERQKGEPRIPEEEYSRLIEEDPLDIPTAPTKRASSVPT